jgi:hypothetical protein
MRGSETGQEKADQEPHADSAHSMRFSLPKKARVADPHRHEKFVVATVEAALRKNNKKASHWARLHPEGSSSKGRGLQGLGLPLGEEPLWAEG